MKHANFNSIVAMAGLLLAFFTAWYQFSPKSDKLMIVSEGLISLSVDSQIDIAGIPNPDDMSIMPLIGPVVWKIRLYNPIDRSVSITSFSVRYLLEGDSEAYYSNMKSKMSPFEAPSKLQGFPEGLAPHTAKAFLLSLSIPFVGDDDKNSKCSENYSKIKDIEECFYRKDRDLFGNRVSYSRYKSKNEESFSIAYKGDIIGPRFKVTFETGDGSKFDAIISYFPFG